MYPAERKVFQMGITPAKALIVTAPSGSGKTTLVRHLMEVFPQLAFSVSATTRARRPHEKDGVDYYFLSRTEFRAKIDRKEFLEWEEVYPNTYYGTLKSEVERIAALGQVVVFDVDVKGAANIKNYFGNNALSLFIMAPSLEVLEQRLKNRATESEKTLQARLDRAREEFAWKDRFDAVIINDDLAKACREAESLVNRFLDTD